MPYITNEARGAARSSYKGVTKAGDRNYLITLIILDIWKQNPCYDTLVYLRLMFFTSPDRNNAMKKFFRELQTNDDNLTWDAFRADMQEAFTEFRLRVGTLYEALKLKQNGDLLEYQEAIKPLQDKLTALNQRVEA